MAVMNLDKIRDEWARLAGAYDRQTTRGLLTPRAAVYWQRVIHKLIGSDAKDVLDVGTGTGLLAVEIAKAGHRVVGVDLTPEMLEQARSRSTRERVDVTWLEGDAMNLPLEAGRFDVTVSRHVLWTMPDPAKAFTEWIRRHQAQRSGRLVRLNLAQTTLARFAVDVGTPNGSRAATSIDDPAAAARRVLLPLRCIAQR